MFIYIAACVHVLCTCMCMCVCIHINTCSDVAVGQYAVHIMHVLCDKCSDPTVRYGNKYDLILIGGVAAESSKFGWQQKGKCHCGNTTNLPKMKK